MFQKILLPVGLGEAPQAAIDRAAELAGPKGEVVLLHVIELIAGLPLEEEKSFYRRLEKTAQAHLASLRKLVESRHVSCREEVRIGNRVTGIIRFAAEMQADVIVLLAPRPTPENPMAGWGSLSYKVSFFSSCPVLLVK
jgi:nucleotide-binding universal stress UspA family protein